MNTWGESMKKYNVFALSVVKQNRGNNTYQYFICEHDIYEDNYSEVFTKAVIKVNDEDRKELVEPLWKYYPPIAVYDYTSKKRKPLMLSMVSLLEKYNEINYVNYNLETDEEIIKEELENRGIYEESKIYKKSLLKK